MPSKAYPTCPICAEPTIQKFDGFYCPRCDWFSPPTVELLTEVRKPGEAFARLRGWKPYPGERS